MSKPGDPLEREADVFAERAARERTTHVPAATFASRDTGAGAELPLALRQEFEPRLGVNLSSVRLHFDSAAALLTQGLDARAVTLGSHIAFGAEEYSPNTVAGRHLLAHELAHVSQVQRGAPHVLRRQARPFQVRSPTLEIAALRSQEAFSFGSAPLLPSERSAAQGVFGSSINLDAVRIVHSPLIAAPTTLGNTIRVPPAYAIPTDILIHELTHIWQYQTMGSAYISDSLWHQTTASVSSLVRTGQLDRGGAYIYTIVPGKSFYAYTAEQQASIVEDYYRNSTLRSDPEFQRLIGQVRAATPVNTQVFWEEAAAGLPPRQHAVPPMSGAGTAEEGGVVPQLEFRFPGL